MDFGNGKYIFDSSDLAAIKKVADSGDAIAKIQYDSVVNGNYMLSREQAANEATRDKSKTHLKDVGDGKDTGFPGIVSGKLPTHITFSSDSPYHIPGAIEGGVWSKKGKDSWEFKPSATQLKEDGYEDKIRTYFKDNEPSSTLNIKKEIPANVKSLATMLLSDGKNKEWKSSGGIRG